jgi:KUP system potassium uptake protein
MKILYPASEWKDILKALGLVFGDIGTSPIYTLTVIFFILPVTEMNVLGIVSLLIWTLIIIVFIQYNWLAMRLDIEGEGGTLILKKILDGLAGKKGRFVFAGFMGFIGVSLMLGDAVLTPSISILSGVEGLVVIPALSGMGLWSLILIAMIITVALFKFQSRGTDRVASAFGPFTLLWFIALSVTGLVSVFQNPEILKAVNPYYAIRFFIDHGLAGFLILSQVILCSTGAEALYADMGHLGRKPISRAWRFVFIALVLNYMGRAPSFSGAADSRTLSSRWSSRSSP